MTHLCEVLHANGLSVMPTCYDGSTVDQTSQLGATESLRLEAQLAVINVLLVRSVAKMNLYGMLV